jgi:hypothetical protein
VAASLRGASEYANEAAPLLGEYGLRMRLSKMGYQFDGRELSYFKARAFDIIGAEIQKFESAEIEAIKAKRGKSGRR